jgi:hypothetical protein
MRISLNREMKHITDASLIKTLGDMALKFKELETTPSDLSADTPDIVLREAITAALQIGTDWWTGSSGDGAYSDIMDENVLRERVLADLMPEMATRLYLSNVLGPKPTKPRVKVKATKEPA